MRLPPYNNQTIYFKFISHAYYGQFQWHTTPKVKDKMNQLELDWFIIPSGTTSFLQPCDASINKPFKERLREHWEEWFSDDDYQFEAFTPGGNRQKHSYQCVVDWVSKYI